MKLVDRVVGPCQEKCRKMEAEIRQTQNDQCIDLGSSQKFHCMKIVGEFIKLVAIISGMIGEEHMQVGGVANAKWDLDASRRWARMSIRSRLAELMLG